MKILMVNFWDYKVWQSLIQFAFICVILLVSNTIRRKVGFIRRSLFPTAVLAGFLGLLIKEICLATNLNVQGNPVFVEEFFETITYHMIAIGFIALTLVSKTKKNGTGQRGKEIKNGLLIVNTYLLQGVLGLAITIGFSMFMDEIASYAGILLPMGFGQGPGQANNVGGILETAGFEGGKTFGLAVATMGFVFACIPGVWYLNSLQRKGLVKRSEEYATADTSTTSIVEGSDEIPLAESMDKITVQFCFVGLIYFLSWLLMFGISSLLDSTNKEFFTKDIKSLVWGFNFIFAIIVTAIVKKIINVLRDKKLMHRKYTNDFLLNRIAGLAFDFMIVSSIIAIDIEMISSWQKLTTLLVMSIVGGVATYYYLKYTTKILYPTYQHQAMSGMYGMLTGTASTGIALLREIDPKLETPAADDLVTGSATAILFGAPILVIITVCKKGGFYVYLSLIILAVIALIYNFFMLFVRSKKANR